GFPAPIGANHATGLPYGNREIDIFENQLMRIPEVEIGGLDNDGALLRSQLSLRLITRIHRKT
ncbi:MAG: hypothetical protein AAF497_10170, partial [Planctomycetota bacterium]